MEENIFKQKRITIPNKGVNLFYTDANTFEVLKESIKIGDSLVKNKAVFYTYPHNCQLFFILNQPNPSISIWPLKQEIKGFEKDYFSNMRPGTYILIMKKQYDYIKKTEIDVNPFLNLKLVKEFKYHNLFRIVSYKQ